MTATGADVVWLTVQDDRSGLGAYASHARASFRAALPRAAVATVELRRTTATAARVAAAARRGVPWAAAGWRLPEHAVGLRGEVVVADHLLAGPAALDLRRAGRFRHLVYVSHNHETSLRAAVERSEHRPLRRIARHVDRRLTARVERNLLRQASLVTAISPGDRDGLRAAAAAPVILLPPPAPLAPRQPRPGPPGVTIVGSTDWSVKARGQYELVAALARERRLHDVPIRLVGRHDGRFVDAVHRLLPHVDVVGFVPDLAAVVADARVFTFDDSVGGGFQMKLLDGARAGRPPVATVASLRGLADPAAYRFAAPDLRAVARTVALAVDDEDACRSAFEQFRTQLGWIDENASATEEVGEVLARLLG